MVKKYEFAISVLVNAMSEYGGRVFSRKVIEVSGDYKAKKSVSANDFLESMLTGKGFTTDMLPIEATEDYKKLVELSKAIEKLSK